MPDGSTLIIEQEVKIEKFHEDRFGNIRTRKVLQPEKVIKVIPP